MTKKQFEDLAARLRAMRPGDENKFASAKAKHIAAGKLEQWQEMVRGMADFCQAQNPRFSRGRFLSAVGE